MRPGPGWQVLSTCADGGATTLYRRVGRGCVVLTNYWPMQASMLENLLATLNLLRSGAEVRFPDLQGLTWGDNDVSTTVTNTGTEPASFGVSLKGLTPGGEIAESAALTLQPGETRDLKASVKLAARGTYHFYYHIDRAGEPVMGLLEAEVVVPQLLEMNLTRPAYRGTAYRAQPFVDVGADFKVHPFGEKLEDLRFWVRVVDGDRVLQELPLRAIPTDSMGVAFGVEIREVKSLAIEAGLMDAAGANHIATVRQDILWSPRGRTRSS
jgi:hypothetical protein